MIVSVCISYTVFYKDVMVCLLKFSNMLANNYH